MKVLTSLVVCFFIISSTFAQETLINVQEFDPSTHYNDITPPSPTVAALNKFIETPVSYYTGVPQITIPIWQIKSKDLVHDISLDYHAGGIKVNEIASWVGLGWSLKAGGTISRSVRGLPDDNPDGRGYLTSQYDYDNILPYEPSGSNAQENFDFSWDIAKEGYDSEPDIFSYSVGGMQGTFVIDCEDKLQISKKNIHLTPWQNIIIEPVVSEINSVQRITGFVITDENGIVYTFGATPESREWSITSSSTDGSSNSDFNTYYSAWNLNSIESKKTQAKINFSYNIVKEIYDNSWTLTQYNRLSVIADYTIPGSGAIRNIDKTFQNFTLSHQTVNTSKLSHISYDLGNIEFKADKLREDLNSIGGVSTGKALESILINDCFGGLVKKFSLKQGYFNEELSSYNSYLTKRLKLGALEEIGVNNETLKYEFEYSSVSLPPRDSYATDYWGYYTNPGTSWSRIPELYYLGKYYSGGKKTPDFEYAEAGTLKSIKYPTGGKTVYEYEQNTYRYIADNPLGLDEEKRELSMDISHPQGDEPTGATISRPEPLPLNKKQFIYTDLKRDNSSFTAVITNEEGESWGLVDKKQIELEPGNYTVTLKASHVCEDNCGLLAGTSASLTISYVEQLQDSIKYKNCGGLRIKSIKSYNPENNVPEKTQIFNYDESQLGFSSGVLVSGDPIYHYKKTTRHVIQPSLSFWLKEPAPIDIRYLVRTSNYINSFNLTQGSCVGYSKVSVQEMNRSETATNGTTSYYFTSGKDYPSNSSSIYPAARRVSNDWLVGKLRMKEVKDINGKTKLIERYNNRAVQSYKVDGRNLATGYKLVFDFYDGLDANGEEPSKHSFIYDKYSYHSGYVFLDSKTTEVYNGDEPIVLTEQFEYYDDKFLLKKHIKETVNEKFATLYKYPFYYFPEGYEGGSHDEAASALYDMNSFHMDNNPVEVVTEKSIGANQKVVQANLIHYKYYQAYKIYDLNSGLNHDDFTPSSISGGNFIFDQTNYAHSATLKRAPFRNPTVIEKRDGSVTSFVWGYKDNLPVAKIDNHNIIDNPVLEASTITDIMESTDQAFIDGHIQTLRNNNSLESALITNYAYKPLVGLFKQTDPNDKSTTYEYDDMQRLKMIRDDENNILKVYKYNFAYPTVSALPSEIRFGFDGGTKVIKLSPGDHSIASSPAWLDASNTNYDPGSNNLTISCGANETTSERTGVFTLINNGTSETTNIIQNPLPFTLSSNELQIEYGKHLAAILVNTAQDVNLLLSNLPSWVDKGRTMLTNYSQIEKMLYLVFSEEPSEFQIELAPLYDPLADPNQAVLLVWATENPNFSDRVGEFIVAGNGLEETVTITLEPKILSFDVVHNLETFEYSLIPQTISIESNAAITINGPDWVRLRVQEPRGGDLPTDDSFLDDLSNTLQVPKGDYIVEIYCLEDNTTVGLKTGELEIIPGVESEKMVIPIQQQCQPVSFSINNTNNLNLSYHSVSNESFGKTLTYNVPWDVQVTYQSGGSGWITPGFGGVASANSGSYLDLNLTISNNVGNNDRTAILTFNPTVEGASAISYSITQTFAYLNLVTTGLPQFSATGGKALVFFDSNIPDAELTVDGPSWLTYNLMLGTVANDIVGLTVPNEYLNKTVLVVTASASNTPNTQSGQITISGAGKSASVSVAQTGNPVAVSINGPNLTEFNNNGSQVQTINVSSNYDNYTVQTNQSWLKIAESYLTTGGTSGSFGTIMDRLSGSNPIDVKCDAKTTVGSRTGQITITSMGVSESITVTQAGVTPSLNVSTQSLSYSCGSSSQQITVSSNISWSATDNASWISTSTSGSTLTIVVDGYGGWGNTRSGSVTVSGGGISRVITITQSGPNYPGEIGGNSQVCVNSTNTYSVPSVDCATSYTWQVPSGWTISSGQGTSNITVVASSISGYVQVDIGSYSGSIISRLKAISVTSSAPATPEYISGNKSAQPNTTYTYTTNDVSGVDSYTWSISSNTGTIISGQGTKTVQVTFNEGVRRSILGVKANNCVGSSAVYSDVIMITTTPIED